MTNHGPHRRRPWRPAALALIAVAALSGACGSNPPAQTSTGGTGAPVATGGTSTGATGGTSTSAQLAQGVKFSTCMRSNGVAAFPDPGPSGDLTIDGVANNSSLDTNSAAFKQALTACKNLEPAGFTGHTRNAQQQEAALKFAQCMRDNGVKDFPDPAPDAPLVDTNLIPSSAGNMPALNAAMRKCGSLVHAALGQ